MEVKTPGGHIDQMIRQTRFSHGQLSYMADIKANMMLTTASVVLTLLVPLLAEPIFRVPVASMMLASVLTIVLAAFTVMPRSHTSPGFREASEVHSPAFNILFFGDFIALSWEQYEAEMEKIINDPSETYLSQLKEIYTLGNFLARTKYRYLRYAYISFISGLIISTILLANSLVIG